jgi:hypothetical protein
MNGMSESIFIGRKEELEWLEGLWRKPSASLVVCAGRRRIGKSTLIEHFAKRSRCRFIEISGLAPEEGMTDEKQRRNFCERLSAATGKAEVRADVWPKAFDALFEAVGKRGRTIVLLDEISWMGGYDKTFPAYLKNAWDIQFSRRADLVFVICGSVSAWIQENILRSKAFVGRVSLTLNLRELPLPDCAAFWGNRIGRVSTAEMADLLSVTGGVPKYLAEMRPELSAAPFARNATKRGEGVQIDLLVQTRSAAYVVEKKEGR